MTLQEIVSRTPELTPFSRQGSEEIYIIFNNEVLLMTVENGRSLGSPTRLNKSDFAATDWQLFITIDSKITFVNEQPISGPSSPSSSS